MMRDFGDPKPSLLIQAQEVEKRLNDLNIGYGDTEGFGMLVSPESFKIPTGAREEILRTGQAHVELFRQANHLYWLSLRNSELFWVRDLFEGKAPGRAIETQRNIFGILKEDQLDFLLPVFFRLDQTSIAQNTIEFETWGAGLGFQLAASTVMVPDGPNLAQEISRRLKEKTGVEQPRVLFIEHNPLSAKNTDFFVKSCCNFGIQMEQSVGKIPSFKGFHLIKRPRLATMVEMPGGLDLLQAWFKRKIVIEPPPNIIYDEKLTTSLPFHPRTKVFFTDEVRSALLVTTLISPETLFRVGETEFRWKDLPKLSGKQRQIVVKYAGNDPILRGNSRAVFEISGSSKEAEDALRWALGSTLMDDPWVAQKRDTTLFEVTFLQDNQLVTGQRYARFNPAFVINNDGSVKLACFSANFSSFWKVQGGPNTLTTGVKFV